MISNLVKLILLLGILLLGVLPITYLLFSNEALDSEAIQELAWSSGTFEISWGTAELALLIACTASLLGWGINALLRFSKSPYLWVALYVLGFTVSPYIAAQGWIQILGTNGYLWDYLNLQPRPDLLYGPYGLTFLLCLQFTPLSLIIFFATAQPVAKESRELQSLTRLSFWKRLYLFELRTSRAAFLFSAILIFWFAFWNYETPSILRQNTYSLSLYAAFGSFYDYSQALGYLLHASAYALPTLLFIIWLTPSLAANNRSLSSTSDIPPLKWYWKYLSIFSLSIIPLCGLVLPVLGLIIDLGSFSVFSKAVDDYSGDIQNSLIVAASASVLTTVICIVIVGLAGKLKGTTPLSLVSVVLLLIPPLCTGIGAVHWFAEHSEGEAGLERIVLVNILILLPILLLPTALAFPIAPRTVKDTRSLFRLKTVKEWALFFKPVFLPRLLLIFGFGFLMTLKEVPASLLNYPPDGSTLALTIETMLHFDQPQLISSLCLIQLLLSIGMFSLISILIHFCKR